MKNLTIFKDPITGKYVYRYKLDIKADEYISSLNNNPITLAFEPSEINTDLWNTLIMPQND